MNTRRCGRCGRVIGRNQHDCPKPRSLWDRFWEKVDASGDCWEWTGSRDIHGYGRILGEGGRKGHLLKASRAVWELMVGPIPPGFEVDHLCKNVGCVNPDHLEPVPPYVNNMRSASQAARNARKTHCKRGHPFDETNTNWFRGARRCLACNRARKAALRVRVGHPAHDPARRERWLRNMRAGQLRAEAEKAA